MGSMRSQGELEGAHTTELRKIGHRQPSCSGHYVVSSIASLVADRYVRDISGHQEFII
jgi:hypothetical protein